MVSHHLALMPHVIFTLANIWGLLGARYYFKFAFHGILTFSLVLLLNPINTCRVNKLTSDSLIRMLFSLVLYLISKYQPKYYAMAGLQNKVLKISCCGVEIPFKQTGNKFSFDVPSEFQKITCPVFKVECDSPPVIYRTAGMRTPKAEHPRYDPITPDIKYWT